MSLVLDRTMTVAWACECDRSATADEAFLWVREKGAWVPGIWRLEVAHALRGRSDVRIAKGGSWGAALAELEFLPIAVDPDTDHHAWEATLAIADRHGISLFDAAYLELAIRLALPLASLDPSLCRAAGAEAIHIFGLAEAV